MSKIQARRWHKRYEARVATGGQVKTHCAANAGMAAPLWCGALIDQLESSPAKPSASIRGRAAGGNIRPVLCRPEYLQTPERAEMSRKPHSISAVSGEHLTMSAYMLADT